MSFGTYARKVLDHELAYGRRIKALAGCVQLYRPLGYQATFSYLEHVAGPFRREEAALLHAVDALSASRETWLAEVRAYANRRTVAKQSGRRMPRSSETNPNLPACWYGDPRRAATFTLNFLLARPERITHVDAGVVRLALLILEADGEIDAAVREELGAVRRRFVLLRETSGWPNVDWPNWQKASQSLWILHQMSNATA